MLNKSTIIFVTNSEEKYVAETLKKILDKNVSVVTAVVPQEKLESKSKKRLAKLLDPKERTFAYRVKTLVLKLFPEKKRKQIIKKIYGTLDEKKVVNMCLRFSPNAVVVDTPANLQGVLNAVSKVGMDIKVMVATNDITIDEGLINDRVSAYFVDNIDMRNALIRKSVLADRIEVNPLPVGEEYFSARDEGADREKFGFSSTSRVIAVKPSVPGEEANELVDYLKVHETEFEYAFICETNRQLYEYASEKGFAVFNECVDMPALISASEAVICRPDSVFMKECAAMKKIVVSINASSKAEKSNVEYLTADSRIIYADTLPKLGEIIDKIEAYTISMKGEAKPDTALENDENYDFETVITPDFTDPDSGKHIVSAMIERIC